MKRAGSATSNRTLPIWATAELAYNRQNPSARSAGRTLVPTGKRGKGTVGIRGCTRAANVFPLGHLRGGGGRLCPGSSCGNMTPPSVSTGWRIRLSPLQADPRPDVVPGHSLMRRMRSTAALNCKLARSRLQRSGQTLEDIRPALGHAGRRTQNQRPKNTGRRFGRDVPNV
jgi:hypothetical protein